MKKIFILLAVCFHLFLLKAQNFTATDCVNYIQICGNQSVALNPTGYGIQEIGANACSGQEHNSLWLRFTVKTSGTLGFDLIPASTDISVDYDFWIFGPNVTCGALGQSIRCSTTNPQAAGSANNHTGMRDSEPENDFFEGPGTHGDNYVKSLNVVAGQTYFLVIDRPIGDGAFSMNWTGTAVLEDPFDSAPNVFGTPGTIGICNATGTYDFSVLTPQILNNNPDFNVYYYGSFDDANYDRNRITGTQTITTKSYYYRIQSTVTECFDVKELPVRQQAIVLQTPDLKSCSIAGTGVFNLNSAVFSTNPVANSKFYKTRQQALDAVPGTEIPNPGSYPSSGETLFAHVTLQDGCQGVTSLTLSLYPVPNLQVNNYDAAFCDLDFDGVVKVKFSEITPLIVQNASDFVVVYALQTAPTVALPDDFQFSQNTPVVVQVRSKVGCPTVTGVINFTIKPKISLATVAPFDVCDSEILGSKVVNLSDYSSSYTTQASAVFFNSLENARQNINPVSANQTITGDTNFYIRFENSTDCPQIATLSLRLKQPRKSLVLQDTVICREATVNLNAGPGFDSYVWDNGATTAYSGEVGVGEHWVDLGSNGCVYRQKVLVSPEPEISILKVEVANNRAVVHATGGVPPYRYSLDGETWQTSNVFENLPKGINTVYVTGSNACQPVVRDFLNIRLINAITPNGDGINDVLDFSEISIMENPSIMIYDRFGNRVFTGNTGNFVWNGTDGNRPVPSGTYWYVIEYYEPQSLIKTSYKSWVLVKRR